MSEQPGLEVIGQVPSYPSSYDFTPFTDNSGPAGLADAIYLQARIVGCEDGTKTAEILQTCLDTYAKNPEVAKRVLASAAFADNGRLTHPTWTYWDMYNMNDAVRFTPDKQTELTRDSFAPLAALFHYIYGTGTSMSVDLSRLSFNFDRSNLAPVNQILNTINVGQFDINQNIGYDFRDSSYWEWTYLGRVSLNLRGTLNVDTAGNWTFNGMVVGVSDRYDANKDAGRGKVGELLTSVLRAMPGTEYEIWFNGEHTFQLSGKR